MDRNEVDPTEAGEDPLEVTEGLMEETAFDINVVERTVGDMVGELVDTGGSVVTSASKASRVSSKSSAFAFKAAFSEAEHTSIYKKCDYSILRLVGAKKGIN